ncbi:Aste57867_19043 [Aphanomyces stellatus]|uniref:1-alkyl-2-acetylglycerophosphocholine esterase n=1 Tax=Aphanomyces stellatus TaxID=120398 RepID=A0A485LBV2_9STRA|nr:hypothetical protein As57867_018979 [Aphanomyces stellatus]VFT95768.1 Aste57867_19043 [Aphanomyces stellatus]
MKLQRSIESWLLGIAVAQSICLHVFPDFHVLHVMLVNFEAVALCFHLWRYELAPIYALVLLNASYVGIPSVVSSAWTTQAILSVVGVLVAAILQPLPSFPPLSSTHPDVGCQAVRLNGLDCRIFYPATRSSHPFTPYLFYGHQLGIGLSVFVPQLRPWFFSSLRNGTLHARADAPLKPHPDGTPGWPVVLYSHGLGNTLEIGSSTCQYLASKGNVVVALTHTDGSAAVYRSPDATWHYYQHPPPSAAKNWDGEGYGIRNNQLHTRVSNVQKVLDAVDGMNQDRASVFYQSMDLLRVAAMGHSFGGATVLATAKQDARIKAVVALDAWMQPLDKALVRDGLAVPTCSLVSQQWIEWKDHHETMQQFMHKCQHPHTAFLAIQRTKHNNFIELPLFSPLLNRVAGMAGPADPTYVLHMTGQLAAGYLCRVLQGDMAFQSMFQQFPELLVLNAKTKTTANDE